MRIEGKFTHAFSDELQRAYEIVLIGFEGEVLWLCYARTHTHMHIKTHFSIHSNGEGKTVK